VTDRLPEEPSLEVVAVSGTSAGAMNAGVLAHGLRRGATAAREAPVLTPDQVAQLQ
jgi:NTE family protein